MTLYFPLAIRCDKNEATFRHPIFLLLEKKERAREKDQIKLEKWLRLNGIEISIQLAINKPPYDRISSKNMVSPA